MKKKYIKPSMLFESLQTESIMAPASWGNGTPDNALSYNSNITQEYLNGASSGTINFEAGSANVLGSIDYQSFLQ